MEVFISLDEAIRRCVPMDFDSKMAVSEAELRRIPAADVRPVVRGYWWRGPDQYAVYCSNCGLPSDEETRFCAGCGADMRDGK